MSEQKVQSKILNWLKDNGFWTVKIITCNRIGVMDIIACSPKGRFIGVEVKWGTNKTSKLQDWNIAEVQKRGGLAFVAYDLDTVKLKLSGELL